MQKNNFIPHLFPEILLRYYKYKFILGTLDVPAPQDNKLVEKSTWSLTSFLRCYILKNPAIWLAESILTHNLTWIENQNFAR